MKKFLFFFITFFPILWQRTYCQSLNIDSTRFITGNQCCAQISYATPTADKGILFTGSTIGNPGGIIPYFSFDTVNRNVLIGKIDSNRQITWMKVYGGNDVDWGGPSCQTPDGGYAVLASTISNDGNVTGYKGGGDIWLLRLDGSGNLLWEKTYGSSHSDGPVSIANTPDHGFIILGTTNGSDGDVPFHYGDFFSMDWLVIKTDSTGNVQWSKDIGGTGDEGEYGSIFAIDGSYYLVSTSTSTDHDCTDTGWHSGVNSGADYYVLKLNDTGKVLWDSSYGGSQPDGIYSAMFDARDSTIVITGQTNSHDYMVTDFHGGVSDMWVIKVDKSGTLLWEKTLGGNKDDAGTGICAAHNGGYIAYGSTFPGPIGIEDASVFSLDDTGKVAANEIFGGTDNEQPNSVLPYLNSYVATGISWSSVFTEGTTSGRNCSYGNAYISYFDYWPLAVPLENKSNIQLIVYPNPTSSKARIILPDNAPCSIAVMNRMGQMIFDQKIEQQIAYTDLDIQQWANGLYLIKWQGENGNVLIAKLIKN